jgi:site-specific recombinase XerC
MRFSTGLYEQDGDLCIRDRLMAELVYGSGRQALRPVVGLVLT